MIKEKRETPSELLVKIRTKIETKNSVTQKVRWINAHFSLIIVIVGWTE